MGTLDISSLPFESLLRREWLIALGNGGYAASTICNCNTRKYHGLLVAAMTPPARRMVILSRVDETVHTASAAFDLASNEYPGTFHPMGHTFLRAFSHHPFPRWAYQGDGWTIEKHLRPVPGQNAVLISYTLLGGHESVELEIRPLLALRGIHELMRQSNPVLDAQPVGQRQHRIPATSLTPEAFISHDGAFAAQGCWYLNTRYRREEERGYASMEDLWMPGTIRYRLQPGQSAHFACSTEPIDLIAALAAAQHADTEAHRADSDREHDAALDTLACSASQFVVRSHESSTAVMAGYPYAPAGGRDAMICLAGLLLVPGRLEEARDLLRSFSRLLRHGLMPTQFAEDGTGWRYQGCDTALWFINAAWQYLQYGGDEAFVTSELLPVIEQIIDTTRGGGALTVHIDSDGLFCCRAHGEPATWMDARTVDAVITPRNGRPVCLSALWYNALRIASDLCRRAGRTARGDELLTDAERTREAFNRVFWNDTLGCCHDVVDMQRVDPSIRPNQLLSISLPFAVLDSSRHAAVVQRVMAELLTPLGVRTLSPHDPDYRGVYRGAVVMRDFAYHQGSAFPWLLGALVTAHRRAFGDSDAARDEARRIIAPCLEHLQNEGNGHLAELFWGDAPHEPDGNLASARSVAELLRCYAEDILQVAPKCPRAAAPAEFFPQPAELPK